MSFHWVFFWRFNIGIGSIRSGRRRAGGGRSGGAGRLGACGALEPAEELELVDGTELEGLAPEGELEVALPGGGQLVE